MGRETEVRWLNTLNFGERINENKNTSRSVPSKLIGEVEQH